MTEASRPLSSTSAFHSVPHPSHSDGRTTFHFIHGCGYRNHLVEGLQGGEPEQIQVLLVIRPSFVICRGHLRKLKRHQSKRRGYESSLTMFDCIPRPLDNSISDVTVGYPGRFFNKLQIGPKWRTYVIAVCCSVVDERI